MEKVQTAAIMRNCSTNYQKAVKNDFLAEIVSQDHHRPRVLFSTINNFLNPSASFTTPSSLMTDDFLNNFIKKVNKIRSWITTAANGCHTMFNVTSTLDHFNELSLSCLTGLDSHMKPTTCATDCISS